MAAMSIDTGPFEVLWGRLLLETDNVKGDFMYWVQHLSDSEKLVGISLFVFVLLLLIVNRARRDRKPVGQGRQFSGALLLVVLFAFGAGWIMDSGGGNFAHLFNR